MKNYKKRPAKSKIPEEDNDDDFQDSEAPKKWFHEIPSDPKKFDPVSEQILIELKEEAKKCYDAEVANFNIKNSKTNSNYQWMKTVMVKGTVSDKIAAYIVTIQDNPIYNLETIRKLVGLVKAGKKKECIVAMETLSELFIDDLLKPKSPLKAFHERPLSKLNDLSSGNAVTRRKLLSAWYFEDQLKETYTSFVLALNNVAHDTVEHNKEKAIGAMYQLLIGNSEQEKNLLAYIVNKLGDPSAKVASKAIYCLGQLLFKQTHKQVVVLSEIEKLLFRPNISSRAQYYGLCFLSQFRLNHKSNDVARRLIEVYFAFFKACVKKGEVDSRMMSSLLMGVNRAYPYAKLEMDKISEHIDTMYRIVHVASFNVSMHALSLLFQVSDHADSISDRFYSALYKKLLDPQLTTTTHQALVLSLVQKALLKDKETSRIKVFIKRLLQVSLHSQPNFACAVLMMVSQVIKNREGLEAFFLKENPLSKFEEDDEEKYFDIKEEDDSELHKVTNGDNIDQGQNNTAPFVEVDTLKLDVEEDVKPDVELLNSSLPATSWYHRNNTLNSKKFKPLLKYDPLSRNPLHAGGSHCAYTELLYLKEHAHPTVALYAKTVLEGSKIAYTGDPLKDFTIIRFLDRFAFKNPKKLETTQGAHPTFGRRKAYQPRGVKCLAVNSGAYLNESQNNIPVDEMFMYMFLQKKYSNRKLKEEDESDIESVQSDEFEEMLDRMGGANTGDEELDFMNDVGSTLKNKTEKKVKSRGDEADSDDEERISDEDEDMEEPDFEDDGEDIDDLDEEELDDLEDLDDEDAESIEFGDSEEEEDEQNFKQINRKSQKRSKNNKSDDVSSLFASADEFATLLEDEGSSKVAPGGSNVFANKDKSATKQLDWEEKRNRWLQGYDRAVGKRKSSQRHNQQHHKKKFNKNKKRKVK